MATHQTTDRDRVVLAKYLLEAHGKERQLETALKTQIALARRPTVEHALRDHLAVTEDQIDALEHRLFDLGHEESKAPGFVAAEAIVGFVGTVANKSLALAKGPLLALRGTSGPDNELRSIRDCYWNEAEEIAHYRVIETVAEQIGDTTTADLARKHRAEEEAMQHTLEGLLPSVVRAVVETKSPDPERDTPASPSPRASASTSSSATKASESPTRGGGTTARTTKPRTAPKAKGSATKRKPAPTRKPAAVAAARTTAATTASKS